MIVIRKIVKANELEQHLRDLRYSKVEIKPASLKKMRDIAILCYHRVYPADVLTLIGCLKQASGRKDLPLEVKDQIAGFCGNFCNNNYWITLNDFKKMLAVEKKYDLNFSIRRRYVLLYNSLIEQNA